ncbi:hypothetical protein P9265_18860 [Schinkia azotoformans]|uniref:hypothetical protein n=1 Tax=Schinkia azotoformans TaxID=1454 RepID=UPI002E210D47|nr:hypothetical protein [Schinkia azotoformans]
MIDENSVEKVRIYNERLKGFYEEIGMWVRDHNLFTNLEAVKRTERLSGEYETYQLIIKDQNGNLIAKMKPFAIWIIGAEGRVDLIGNSGVEKIVYLSKGGPSISTTISTSSGIVDQHEHKIFGDKEEGWHWVDHIVIGKQPKLDKDIFLKLLEVVN